MKIFFTATIYRVPNGFIARADELGFVSDPAPTQRRALASLKAAIRTRFTVDHVRGTLTQKLADAGYAASGEYGDIELRPHIQDKRQLAYSSYNRFWVVEEERDGHDGPR